MGSEGSALSVSVIIPARDEAGGIVQIIDSVRSFCDEILVIDGHSTDGTGDLAREAGATVYLDNGKGKGDAYKVGIEKAKSDVIVFIDADGSHESSDIPELVKPIVNGEADLVIASRHRGGSDEWEGDMDTWLRAIGSGFLSVVINRRWKSSMTDVLNGFRAGRREMLRTVPFRADDFDIEQHMIVQCLKHGYRVTEVSSHEYCRKWGASKLPTFRRAHIFFWRLFLDLVQRK